MKLLTVLLVVITVVALAYNVGMRVPAETVALGLGVVLGALTSVPLSLVVGSILGRREQPLEQEELELPPMMASRPPYPRSDVYQQARDYPPLVIINPGTFQNARQPGYAAAAMQSLLLPTGPREFRVVGEEAT